MIGRTLLSTFAILALGTSPLRAATTFIVESRSTGQHYANYADSGFADSTGNVNAPGTTLNIGSRYSGTGTYFGPSRYAQFSYAPTAAGYYEVDLAWTLAAAEINTAVNIYTGTATGNTTPDIWGNTGGPKGVIYSTTMNMLNNGTSGTGTGTWKPVSTVQMNAGTTYKVGLYGGYKTPYAGGATPADASANRVIAGAARFIAATPGGPTYGGPADDATDIPLTGAGNDLSWTAGTYTSLFDLWFGTTSGSLTKIGSNLSATTLSYDLDSQGLVGDTEYFWRIDAKNVDVTTQGAEFSFTTIAVPEPSTMVLGLIGGLGLMWMIRRRAA